MHPRITTIVYLSGIALAAAWPAVGACPDDFSGPGLAPAWTFLDADGVVGGTAAIVGGRLELTGRGRDAFNAVNEFVGIARSDISGDFDVSVKLESQSNTHPWAQAGILAATDPTDLTQGGYVVLDATPSNGYLLFYDAAQPIGTLDKYVKSESPSGYPVWLRLAKSGNKFSAWYKQAAGAPWIVLAKDIVPLGDPAPSRLGLMSLSHNAAMDGKAVFEDFACLHAPTAIRLSESSRRALPVESIRFFPTRFAVDGRRRAGPALIPRP